MKIEKVENKYLKDHFGKQHSKSCLAERFSLPRKDYKYRG